MIITGGEGAGVTSGAEVGTLLGVGVASNSYTCMESECKSQNVWVK